MSVETKIKELLEGKTSTQLQEEATDNLAAGGVADTGAAASAKQKKDSSKAAQAAVEGDKTNPMQGSSEKASFETSDEGDDNPGAKASSSISNQSGTIATKGDAKSVKTMAMEEVDVKSELSSIFGEDLSEEFKTKATSIFEAAVIARVNAEMDKVLTKLEEHNEAQIKEFKDSLVDKIDSYLNYVVENWMDENQLALESGLKTEITEEFITGLKTLFKENYIEVPEDKYNVLEDLTDKVDSLTVKLDESISENVELSKQVVELKKQMVIEEQSKDLVATESEKFKKLVEGVDFDTDELFKEKISVIKENYFPKNSKPAASQQVLVEDTEPVDQLETDSVMNKYISAISRSVKVR